MALTISFPFRLALNGQVASVEQGSDEANAEAIALLIMTRPGERPVVPGFGIPEPAFAGFTLAPVVAGMSLYGPDVDIDSVDIQAVSESAQRVDIEFS